MDPRLRSIVEIETLHEILEELDYYQLLKISADADSTAIDPAYRTEARRLHPDRYATVGDAPFRRKVNHVYRAVSDAYRTLRDADARRTYDQELAEGRRRMDDAARKEAEAAAAAAANPELAARTDKGGKYWKLALQCYKDADYNGAVMQIQFALTFEPDNDVFKEWKTKCQKLAEDNKKDTNPFKLRIV